jgi:hypothetical protein
MAVWLVVCQMLVSLLLGPDETHQGIIDLQMHWIRG